MYTVLRMENKTYFRSHPIFLASVIAVLGAINPIFAKVGLEAFPPFMLIFLRFFFAILAFIPFLKVLKIDWTLLKTKWKPLLIVGIVSALNPIILFIALTLTEASVSSFIYAVVPALTALYLVIFHKKIFSAKVWTGIVLGLTGVSIVILLPGLHGHSLKDIIEGNLLILAAAIAFMFYGIISKRFQEKENLSSGVLTFSFIVTTLVLSIPFAWYEAVHSFSIHAVGWQHISAGVIMGVFGTTLFYFLYQKVIHTDNEVTASLFVFIQPVVTPILAFFVLGEQITPLLIIGGACAIIGAYLAGNRKETARDVDSLQESVKNIVEKARDLKNKYTDQKDAPVNYACIFAQTEDEYESLLQAVKKIGTLIKETPSGLLFKVSIDTVAGKLQILKIRKPDPTRPERRDADFTVSDYPAFKEKYLSQAGFKLIQKDGFEMIELYDEHADVRAYFSFPPLDKQFGYVA